MSATHKKSFVVQHQTIGRIRIRVSELRTRPDLAGAMEEFLDRAQGLRGVEARSITGSLIIFFDPSTLKPETVVEKVSEMTALLKSMDQEAITGLAMEKELASANLWERQSIIFQAARLITLTGFIVFGLVRSTLFGAPLPGNVVSAAAGMGMIPLALRGVVDLKEGRGITVNIFLTTACALAIVSGSAAVALEVIWVSEVSRFLEEIIKDRSRRAVRELLDSSTRNVFVIVDGVEVETSPMSVMPGDLVSARKGDRICVDGVIADGEALVNEASLTGRAQPEFRTVGEMVFCGMIVLQGRLLIRAEKTGRETLESRNMAEAENSLVNRAPCEIRADQLAREVTRIGSLATFLALLITGDLGRTLAVQLVMACPCATALAASAAISAAMGISARNKTLVKGGVFLERYNQGDCFCFDKTGALSDIEPVIEEIHPRSSWIEPQKLISLAAAAEGDSIHPVALTLKKLSALEENTIDQSIQSEEVLGRGVRAKIGQDLVTVGNLLFMNEEGVNVSYFKNRDASLRQRGLSVVYVARNQKVQGIIGLTFRPRDGARETIDGLKRLGIKDFHIISGDSEEAVAEMARAVGVSNWISCALPEDKAAYVCKLEDKGKKVIMVGDGVNDTLAMSKAFVGVAMGKDGAQTAILASDITIADSNPTRLVELGKLGKETFRVIDQNYALSIGSDLVAAGLVVSGMLSPLAAGMIHMIHFGGIALSSFGLMSSFPPSSSLEM